jgi:hypothetical protein
MSDMNKAVGTDVLLTSDDIRRWQDELRKWEATKAEAEARIVDVRRKLEAAAFLSGSSITPLFATNAGQDGDGEESMADAGKRLLAAFSKPVMHHELQAELRKIPRFRDMLDKNNGAYYYTMVNRLAKRGDIKKVGKKIRLIHKNETPSEGNPEGAS